MGNAVHGKSCRSLSFRRWNPWTSSLAVTSLPGRQLPRHTSRTQITQTLIRAARKGVFFLADGDSLRISRETRAPPPPPPLENHREEIDWDVSLVCETDIKTVYGGNEEISVVRMLEKESSHKSGHASARSSTPRGRISSISTSRSFEWNWMFQASVSVSVISGIHSRAKVAFETHILFRTIRFYSREWRKIHSCWCINIVEHLFEFSLEFQL